MKEEDLQQRSANFSGKYAETRLEKSDLKFNLILQTVAHGFYIGARRAEEMMSIPKWMFWKRRRILAGDSLQRDAKNGAVTYMAFHHLRDLNWVDRNLVLATLISGFKEGYVWRWYDESVSK